MITYFDTSALLTLLVAEPGSALCRRLWNDADDVVSSRLLYVEAAATLARAARMGRLTTTDHSSALGLLDELAAELDMVEIDDLLVRRAAALAREFELRGFDAVHCAAAEQLSTDDLVVASGDQALLAVCRGLGMATADTNV